ncbi:uncharacterized protein LOC133329383 [Musca vetustissima]|uniref:uncharacterized protein LOC133329383 n=1 Tax=Musca vetustissima TaxID=27455 RepID=UPI002AB6C861|nr:uncharacterized protein LOC133329383 [Musca vetustissima]
MDENLKLTQLAIREFKVDNAHDFCLNSLGNDMLLGGNSYEFHILEMLYSVELLIPLPYHIKYVQVSHDKPLTNLSNPIDLVKIYETANVLESQELSMDPLYVYECSVEPIKPRLLQADLVQGHNNEHLCCMLNTYGSCELLHKDVLTHEWIVLKTNLNNVLLSNVFPLNKTPKDIKNFSTYKEFIGTYTITAFTWSFIDDWPVIYVATAIGYVVALKFRWETNEFVELFRCKTSMGRITYMTTKDNLLIAACNLGQVALLTIDSTRRTLTEKHYLWSKKDRMNCRKAIINYSQLWKSYFIVYCKGANILAYRLDTDGNILSNSTLYTKGIKVTGLEYISSEEFIVTTILGIITYIRINCPSHEELIIETQNIDHDLDTTNLQILGVAASESRSLWSFFLSRNKDYTHQSKHSPNTAFISVCKISNHDSLIKLININLNTMDVAKDLVLSINLDIINNLNADKYNEFMSLSRLSIPKILNDAYLQKLQIKLLIVRNFAKYQKMKYKNVKRNTEMELIFLEAIVQMLYIIQRLQYLQTVRTPDVKLSSFQELSVTCMQSQFSRLINGLANNESESNHLQNTMEQFKKVLSEEYNKCCFETDGFKCKPERCEMCDADISATTFDKCREGHEVRRCTISYVQKT